MSGLLLDLKLLLLSSWAMKRAWKNPQVMPFTVDKRDTKDSALTLPDKPKNQRRRLDKNLTGDKPRFASPVASLALPLSRRPSPLADDARGRQSDAGDGHH